MSPAVLLRAEHLGFAYPGHPLLSDLSFDIVPGLTLVRGGDGRGKSTLLRLLAGTQQPTQGRVHRYSPTLFHAAPTNPDDDALTGWQWLQARRSAFPAWDAGLEGALIEPFGLTEHITKPLYMLSTGSRRKVGLIAACASRAQVTLLDTPFGALDLASCRMLSGILVEAAGQRERAWVVADHERPPGLEGISLAGLIDLGD